MKEWNDNTVRLLMIKNQFIYKTVYKERDVVGKE